LRRIAVIVNPAAGGGRAGRALEGVKAALGNHGLEYRIDPAGSLEHAGELARAAAAGGEVAVAFGGDGLIGAVAGALKGPSGVFGVLPGGRGNDFARVLGIPLDPRAACRVLAHGTERALDLCQANGRTFIGIASCGFDSDANRIANETTVVRGSLVYSYGALRALIDWKPATFTLRLDGGDPRTVTGYTIAAANAGTYGGGMRMAPGASLEDGLLDVVMVEHMPKLRFLRLLPSVFKGTHVRRLEVHVLRAAEIEISADRQFALYADGDPVAELPVTIRVLPGAIRAITPVGR
jgi:YegS/Rv2252/BmrU family lipid kinase